MFRLLIVEDEETSRIGLQSSLSSISNLVIETACNGQDGYIKATQWHPDIIITDIHMPILNGLLMIEKLYQESFNSIIYLLTGYAEFEYARKALQYHVEDYILKPVVASQLKNTIENQLKELNRKRNSQNPQLFHLLSNEDSILLTEQLSSFGYTNYFLAVVYMEHERHLPPEVKDALTEEPHHYILTLPDKHYRGILIGFTSQVINYRKIYQFSSLLEPYAHLTCIYEIKASTLISDWVQLFEKLRNSIPWSITCRSSFLAYETYMSQNAGELIDDPLFKKNLQRKLCNSDFTGYKKILLEKLYQMQRNICHPNHIITTAVSGLVKLTSKHAYLEAVNQLSGAKSMHEIQNYIESYFDTFESPSSHANYSPLVRKALRSIEKSYKEPISLNSIAEQLNITPQYLSRIFMKEVSHSFIDCLTSCRIEHAKTLLQNTNMKINIICIQVGYQDAKYFCTLFKKITGVTPNQYRASKANTSL